MMSLAARCSGHGLLNVYLGSNSYCRITHSSMYSVDTISSTLEGLFDKCDLIVGSDNIHVRALKLKFTFKALVYANPSSTITSVTRNGNHVNESKRDCTSDLDIL